MRKFHIKPDGTIALCSATKGKCPFGEEDEHYSTKEEAYEAFKQSIEITHALTNQVISKIEGMNQIGFKEESFEIAFEAVKHKCTEVTLAPIEFLEKHKLKIPGFEVKYIRALYYNPNNLPPDGKIVIQLGAPHLTDGGIVEFCSNKKGTVITAEVKATPAQFPQLNLPVDKNGEIDLERWKNSENQVYKDLYRAIINSSTRDKQGKYEKEGTIDTDAIKKDLAKGNITLDAPIHVQIEYFKQQYEYKNPDCNDFILLMRNKKGHFVRLDMSPHRTAAEIASDMNKHKIKIEMGIRGNRGLKNIDENSVKSLKQQEMYKQYSKNSESIFTENNEIDWSKIDFTNNEFKRQNPEYCEYLKGNTDILPTQIHIGNIYFGIRSSTSRTLNENGYYKKSSRFGEKACKSNVDFFMSLRERLKLNEKPIVYDILRNAKEGQPHFSGTINLPDQSKLDFT
jgi:hypothetical protein